MAYGAIAASRLTTALIPYSTSAQIAATYSTPASVTTQISAALTPYSTSAQINTLLGSYLTTTNAAATYSTPASVDTQISTALTPYSTTVQIAAAYVPSAAQSGRKFAASPADGTSGAITYRAIVAADIPALSYATSVGLALPSELTVTNSPVTGSGTLTGVWANQTTGKVFAAPNGSTGTPTFRTIASADLTTALTTPPAIGGTTPGTAGFTTTTIKQTQDYSSGAGVQWTPSFSLLSVAGISVLQIRVNNEMLAIGGTAGRFAQSTAYNNVFLGHGAGSAVTTGGSNTFVGSNAGRDLTTGGSNLFYGAFAGLTMTTGNGNVMIGNGSGQNATGSTNIFVGNSTGANAGTSTGSVFVGNAAGYYETNSNRLILSNQQGTNQADAQAKAILYGVMATTAASQTLQFNVGSMGFFAGAPAAKPTITGSRGGNAALASLLTGLASLSLITDSTTA